MFKNYLLIFLSIAISVVAQTFLKSGMNKIGAISTLDWSTLWPLILQIATNINIIIGISMYVVGTFFWLVLLSRLDLSFLYPFGALQYLLIFIISFYFLGEEIKPARIIGVIFILIGILIIGKYG
ncbi:hypothetical protein A2Y99_05080 [Candidatus Gottesmanbacteria bacterium RBG_13_37_7]|uniref:EamA domain-containing protein n=1 Tax=Candidatus Gottesmanbacteria bacterium RBG_13_37_7 TaxID=1798369 RepID=A0A1F5YJ49_9BACT|nr:MAG: hypothetical protein A2Y99_05080 [Candidatus Gottesmanbacteria bacterium RBG_13_37_7]